MKVYIGYDPREEIAAAVCASSIRRHSDAEPISLKWNNPDVERIYQRPYERKGTQYLDGITGAPFSTQFSFTRFLVPYLEGYQGWAIFCDCDFLFRSDIEEVLSECDPEKAVYVVQHEHNPPSGIKMDGVQQTRYYRKNWSSFIVWNCEHRSNRWISPAEVNRKDGRWLHAFKWLKDDEIGALPVEWNYLVGHNTPDQCKEPKAVHYTEGGPWWAAYRDVPFSTDWKAEMEHFIGEDDMPKGKGYGSKGGGNNREVVKMAGPTGHHGSKKGGKGSKKGY